METVCIVGLGYVGLPLAELCVKKKKIVLGFDINKTLVDSIRRGINPIENRRVKKKFEVSTNDLSYFSRSDVIVVCVPTPIDKFKMPNLSPVMAASRMVASNIGKNKPLVIIESTINPGVMEDVVKPIFDEAGLQCGKDYHLAHCPERINPGDARWSVGNIPRVVGAFTKKGLDRAHRFYNSIIDAPIMKMSHIRVAEACKIVENTFRDVNIAFVNELAKSFEKMDIDVVEVIKGASTKPFAFMAHYPSCGVGGHCIPVDPYYLIEKAKSIGFDHEFLRVARDVNNSMPKHTVELLVDALNEQKKSVNGTTIGVLGLSYKADVGDDRESPSYEIINLIRKKGGRVIVYDPYMTSDCRSLSEFQSKCKHIVICTDHKEYFRLNLKKVSTLVDGKNMFYGKKIPKNCVYKGIGRARPLVTDVQTDKR